ncbi:MAG TPA: hypothetical protein VMV45_07040 [Casimicrobiaceae bacterium]|nr:hypothetical protein [Casimicrobiaceae bacterium]
MLRAIVLLALAGMIGAIAWQQLRYLHARRDVVHDAQPLLYSTAAFHVLTFLYYPVDAPSDGADDRDLLAALRELRAAAESGGDARVVYAGKVAVNALASTQLVARFGGEVPWSAVLLTQFDSRAAADRIMAGDAYHRALARFARTYACGMQRSPWLNLGFPMVLLGKRIGQILTRAPSHFPFVPAEPNPAIELRATQLLAAREYGAHAVVVANLLREGTSENAAADRQYTQQMFGLMAEGVHGPMHIGTAVPLADGDRFDRVALVYYPGVQYFADMMRSRFYRGIVGDKQLGDTQASITVPLLDRL